MPSNLTELDVYTTPIVVPNAGEEIRANDWIQAAGALANRTKYARERVLGLATSYLIQIPLLPISTAGFSFTLTAGLPSSSAGWKQQASPTGSDEVGPVPFWFPMSGGVSLTAKLSSITVTFRPAAGHSALPANKPKLRFYRQDNAAAAGSQVTEVIDNPADVTAYQTTRVLTATLNYVLTNFDAFYITFIGESGANSVGGLTLLHASALYSLS
jgi:hypothetical protein